MAFFLAILAALPLAAAHAFGAVAYNHLLPRQDSVSSVSSSSFNPYIDCSTPSTFSLGSQIPTPAADLESALETITDACQLLTGSFPASVASDFDSYTSALISWESANAPALSSYESYLTSWQSSVLSATPACSSVYNIIANTDDGGGATTANLFSNCPAAAASLSGSSAGTTSAAANAASSAGTTSAAANAASSASAGSSTSKPSSAASAVGAPHTAVFILGASVAIGCFVAMIVL